MVAPSHMAIVTLKVGGGVGIKNKQTDVMNSMNVHHLSVTCFFLSSGSCVSKNIILN